MRSILIRVLVCSAVVLSARAVFALGGFSDTSLIDTDQNQALVQGLQADLVLDRPVLSQSFPKLAAVHFITGSSGQTFDTQENDFADPSGEYCQRYGFTVTSCPSGLFNQACPYNDKIYDKCCDAAYTYTSATCSTPKQLSADTCGGKHRCYCDTATYPYASCDSPQIKGEACTDESGARYKTCVCPSPAADTGYGCESYYAAPCGSVCSKYYADNCRNRTHNDYGYGCAKYWDDCASKCETPYTDNCRNRNAVSAPYGCQQYYSDCQSKCEIAYSDNCRNRTAVISSCPTNATCQTYSDCSSKISSWSCNSGYTSSGSSCKLNQAELPILYSNGITTTEILSNGYPVGVVIDETNRLAVAVQDINREGKETSTAEQWSQGITSASNSFCTYNSVASCDFTSQIPATCGAYGQNNTTKILNDPQIHTAFNGSKTICKNVAYAAIGCFNYEPSKCEKDFCKKTKWFLPSMNELVLISSLKAKINKTMETLNYGKTLGYGRIIKEETYCSSNKADLYNIWVLNMKNNSHSKILVYDSCFIRPVVYY